MKVKKKYRWLYNTILIHVARTWERVRIGQPFEEMPLDNVESADTAIPEIADRIFSNSVIQGFINAKDQENYWIDNTEEGFSDSYIENVAEVIINKEYIG